MARRQLVLLKKDPKFTWLNMAPTIGGQRPPLAAVADAVTRWFTDSSPLPAEWDGTALKELVRTVEVFHWLMRIKVIEANIKVMYGM